MWHVAQGFFKVDYNAEHVYLLTETLDERDEELLSCCGATSIDTHEVYGNGHELNEIERAALEWLNKTCNISSRMTNPLEDSRLTDAANALGEYCISIDEIAVAKFCRFMK